MTNKENGTIGRELLSIAMQKALLIDSLKYIALALMVSVLYITDSDIVYIGYGLIVMLIISHFTDPIVENLILDMESYILEKIEIMGKDVSDMKPISHVWILLCAKLAFLYLSVGCFTTMVVAIMSQKFGIGVFFFVCLIVSLIIYHYVWAFWISSITLHRIKDRYTDEP
jgi:hypothetical protein